MKDNAKSFIHAPWKFLIAMRHLVWMKLDGFLKWEIIVPVTTPSDWVSPLTYTWKANVKTKDIIADIHHDHFHTPTMEEITYKLASSTQCTIHYGTSSYLCFVLYYKTSLLTPFNTPWGHCRFVFFPWGLASTQDIFQRKVDQIQGCYAIVIRIMDVIVHNQNDEKKVQQMTCQVHTSCS